MPSTCSRHPTAACTAVQAAVGWREHVDGIPARQAVADQAQQERIADSVRIMLGRERERAQLNPLDYTQVADAWKAAHGRQPPKSLLSHWAHDGVTQSEHDSDWHQNGLKAKQVRD